MNQVKTRISHTTVSKISSLIVLGLAVLGLVFLIFKSYLFAAHPVGIIVQISAAGLMIWARITFGIRSFHAMANTTKGRLVTNGPYRWLRHPIYAAIIYFVWAGVLSSPFADAIAAAVLISVSLIARMLLEEKFLRMVYGEYSEYSRHAKLLIPFIF